MEYKILEYVRNNLQLPFFIRLIISFILISLSLFPIVLPLFPGSLFLGIFMLIAWIILLIKPKKVRHVIKLRKSLFHLFKNLHRKRIIKHKVNDIKKHVFKILDDKVN